MTDKIYFATAKDHNGRRHWLAEEERGYYWTPDKTKRIMCRYDVETKRKIAFWKEGVQTYYDCTGNWIKAIFSTMAVSNIHDETESYW